LQAGVSQVSSWIQDLILERISNAVLLNILNNFSTCLYSSWRTQHINVLLNINMHT